MKELNALKRVEKALKVALKYTKENTKTERNLLTRLESNMLRQIAILDGLTNDINVMIPNWDSCV